MGGGNLKNLLQLKGHAALLVRKRKALERVILDAAAHAVRGRGDTGLILDDYTASQYHKTAS